MLPKALRMERKDFPSLSKEAFFKSNNTFILRFKKISTPSKFSFSVSKKVAKNAVDRNRMRRQGYRCLQILLPKFKENVLANFSFKRLIYTQSQVSDNLNSILKDAKLINSN